MEGLKRAVAVAVGEKHSLALQRWAAVQLEGLPAMPWLQSSVPAASSADAGDEGPLTTPRSELGSESSAGDLLASPGLRSPSRVQLLRARTTDDGVESLQRICEREVARTLVDPRACLQARARDLLARWA